MAIAALLGLTLGMGACDLDSLVELEDPDLITLPTVQDTANIETLRNGAISEFAMAMTGPAANNTTPGIIGVSGVMADELWYSSTFETMLDIDRRRIFDTNGAVETVYRNLHRARNLSNETARLYSESRPNSPDRALLQALNGYTYVMFAENFCSGVPFSRAPLGESLVYGAGLTMEQMLDTAIAHFDEAMALAQSAGASDYANLARVGKARALQNLGDFSGAATVASQVPDAFVYEVTYSPNSSGQNNGVWYNINSSGRTSAASLEGVNGLKFFERGPGPNTIDPRAPADSSGFGIGEDIPLYTQGKYASRGAGVTLASGLEAQLIEAEAALVQGSTGPAFQILNDLRGDIGLGSLTPAGTADGRLLQLYEERAFWMWLTAHRLGDMRRLVREHGFSANQVFPIGTTIAGTQYEDDVNLPVPEEEKNNPLFTGCFNRGA